MIRKAEVKDIFAIVRLEERIFKQTLGFDFLEEEIRNNANSYILVYELNQQIVGYIGCRLLDESAEILNFLVDENYQNQGKGKALMHEMLQALQHHKIKKMILEVRKSNKQARRFYESLGFKKSYIRKDYYLNEDAYVYIKDVDL